MFYEWTKHFVEEASHLRDGGQKLLLFLDGFCNNFDPSGSVFVRRGKGVLGSGKLQHHQPLSRVADMTPVNGRIELQPRKGDGSMDERCHQRVGQPI